MLTLLCMHEKSAAGPDFFPGILVFLSSEKLEPNIFILLFANDPGVTARKVNARSYV